MSAENKNKKLEKRFEPLSSFPSRWMFGACPCRNFGMTQNYIIMIEMPLVLNLMKLAATYIKGYCATDWLDWRPSDGVRFYLVHKTTGEVVKGEFDAETPFITPIVVNAYENDDEEVIKDKA
jgi:carotenoid cleavage dioxygenase-like enzyme